MTVRFTWNKSFRLLDSGLSTITALYVIALGCSAQGCIVPTSFEYGEIHKVRHDKNEIKFVCNRQFDLIGPAVASCENGEWNVHFPICKHRASCYLDLSNGVIEAIKKSNRGDWALPGSAGIYTCDQGFTRYHSTNRIFCRAGKWEPTPKCITTGACSNISPQNGFLYSNMRETESTSPLPRVRYSCKEGYMPMSQNDVLTCRDGKWDPEPKCIPYERCPPPPPVKKAFFNEKDVYKHGETIRYSCKAGYRRESDAESSLTCHSGKWLKTRKYMQPMKCVPVNCGRPPAVPNTIIKGGVYSFNNVVRYFCKKGYREVSSSWNRALCQANGRWTVVRFQCEIVTCPKLVDDENCEFKMSRGRYMKHPHYMTEWILKCKTGCKFPSLELNSTLRLTCTEHGTWSEGQPKCEAVTCPRLEQDENRFYKRLFGKNFEYASIYRVGCNDSKQGETLDISCGKDGRWSEQQPKCKSTDYKKETSTMKNRQDGVVAAIVAGRPDAYQGVKDGEKETYMIKERQDGGSSVIEAGSADTYQGRERNGSSARTSGSSVWPSLIPLYLVIFLLKACMVVPSGTSFLPKRDHPS